MTDAPSKRKPLSPGEKEALVARLADYRRAKGQSPADYRQRIVAGRASRGKAMSPEQQAQYRSSGKSPNYHKRVSKQARDARRSPA